MTVSQQPTLSAVRPLVPVPTDVATLHPTVADDVIALHCIAPGEQLLSLDGFVAVLTELSRRKYGRCVGTSRWLCQQVRVASLQGDVWRSLSRAPQYRVLHSRLWHVLVSIMLCCCWCCTLQVGCMTQVQLHMAHLGTSWACIVYHVSPFIASCGYDLQQVHTLTDIGCRRARVVTLTCQCCCLCDDICRF